MSIIRIGSFARIAQVSTRALRLYDKLGLLKPALVDPDTDYRYYSIDQLPRLNRILALKDLGFSLEQIAEALRGELSAEQLRGMLMLRRAEAERRVAEEQAQLARIEARLRQIEQEHTLASYAVVLKRVEPLWVAAVHARIPEYITSEPIFIGLFEELDRFLRRRGLRGAGPRMALFDDLEARDHDLQAQAAVALPGPLAGDDRVEVYRLPGVARMACVVHHGPYDETLIQANTALLRWADTNGFRVRAPTREVYLHYQAGGDPARFVTEIQFPVEPGAAS
ncbi:MerR family transcriptional regulator [Kouleothrix sp.]|uniref:MerR family transcriptional regulator n=1 Tax=Kouleothrix sp. TaxID=2779161 RepID=UPI00391CB8F9